MVYTMLVSEMERLMIWGAQSIANYTVCNLSLSSTDDRQLLWPSHRKHAQRNGQCRFVKSGIKAALAAGNMRRTAMTMHSDMW